jgi:phosphate:Na+ symporter
MPWLPQLLAHLADAPRMQVVNFHVAFNAALAAGFIFFADQVGRMVSRWVPPAPGTSAQAPASHLDAGALTTPTLALANAARETLRIGDTIEQMLNGMMEVIRTNDEKRVEELIRLDDDVDRLYTAIKLYLTQISREALDEKDGRRWAEIISLTINLEHVGDVIERILADIKDKKIAHRLSFSDEGMQELSDLHAKLVANLRLGLSVFLTGDVKSAQMLLAEKEKFRDLERSYAALHLDRLADQSVQSIETSSLHLDIISDMRRINSFFCSTAYPILEQAGQLRKSRLRSAATGEATGAFSKSGLAARTR